MNCLAKILATSRRSELPVVLTPPFESELPQEPQQSQLGRSFVPDSSLTSNVARSWQGESDCLIKQVIIRLLSSVQCSAICANLWSDFMEGIHDEHNG